MSYNLQSNQPGLRIGPIGDRSWATTGNTDVVLDSNVTSKTVVCIMNTSQQAGRWYVTRTFGTGFTITSSDSETAGATYLYQLI